MPEPSSGHTGERLLGKLESTDETGLVTALSEVKIYLAKGSRAMLCLQRHV